MRLVDRYIGRTVLAAMAVVLLAFGGINTLFPLIDELGDARNGYGATEAITYVLLTTPRRVHELMPYVVFMGALVGLGSLANQSELVVLRAGGVSVGRIYGSVVIAALPVLVLTFALGEWLAPWGEASGDAMKAEARYGSAAPRLRDGLWYREGSLFMSVNAMDTEGNLIGVHQYRLNEDQSMAYALAARIGRYHGVPGGGEDADSYWVFEGVTETRFSNGQATAQTHDQMRWYSASDPQLLSTSVLMDPRKLALTDLRRQISFMRGQGHGADRYQLAWWTKLLQPLATLGLVLIAVSFILGPLREHSMGVRIATGIVVGLCFQYLQDLFGPMAMVYAFPAWLAVVIPIAIAWLAGIYGLRRVG